jgi:hypothetical protein
LIGFRYTKSIKEADYIDLADCLQEQMMQNYALSVSQNNDEHFSTSTELQEFYEDGMEIADRISDTVPNVSQKNLEETLETIILMLQKRNFHFKNSF